MKLIVGLGNPGKEYVNTRHNTGYILIDSLEKLGLPKGVVLEKTRTFMNHSGEAINSLVKAYKLDLDDLYVVHDDLDLKIGEYKVQKARGPRDHKGIDDIERKLKSDSFWRIRVGIDNRQPNSRTPGEKYVLQKFTDSEISKIKNVAKKLVNQTDLFN